MSRIRWLSATAISMPSRIEPGTNSAVSTSVCWAAAIASGSLAIRS
jgi:hypothetical protein